MNWYDLYQPASLNPVIATGEDRYREVVVDGKVRRYKRGRTMSEYTPWMKHVDNGALKGELLSDYMNDSKVKKALNVDDAIDFEMCNSGSLEYHPEPEASKWIYQLLRNKIKILFYSGDTDGALPTVGSKNWIKSLGWSRVNDTRPWYTNEQVSGFLEQYDGMDFVTVHGTGHMAPEWKPQQVTEMISAWIHNEEF